MNRYVVQPGSAFCLSSVDPEDTSAFAGSKDDAREELAALTHRLQELQELLYAEHRHRVLVVLQAMDTGGKDGVIRWVFGPLNPQGVKVVAFKVPTPEELDHDFLWRIHKHTPGRGEMVIFNRSHYEDVLVVRVRSLVPREVWSRRYEHIRAFEKMLAEEGTTIVKFFLHIDAEEQKKRLQARLEDPTKRWKFNPDDLKERALWDEYMAAYQDALTETSLPWAPWYVIPSNKKWYRNVMVARTMVSVLESLEMSYPTPSYDPAAITIS